ncbi:hypothetical protein QQS21_009988 [Conoideocrella luteorostrata]|uniref:Uncharacterized protein n=1 Tax=Conoideocrella luteorostrata TaxID=1105319 RepID=A0AAJ0CG77_9HYPO|nr:hypothetical protein QQS21_009988 [Conoideocrella luteorostrata]
MAATAPLVSINNEVAAATALYDPGGCSSSSAWRSNLEDDDRPVYALRARGFERGRSHLSPYTRLYASTGESSGSSSRQARAFNLPPHIKTRMRRLDHTLCLLHLAYFLGLITEENSNSIEDGFSMMPLDEATAQLFAIADKKRMDGSGARRRRYF